MLFGYPWFRKFNLDIDWEKSELKGPKVKIETLLYGTLQRAKSWLKSKNQENEDLMLRSWAYAGCIFHFPPAYQAFPIT